MVKRQLLLLVAICVLAACRGGSQGSPGSDSAADAGSGIKVKVNDQVGSAPLPLPTGPAEGPAERGATGITSDAAATCLNANEAELARLINEYRASLELPPVPVTKSMTLVAQQHAWDSQINGTAWPPPPAGKSCNMHSWTDKVNPALKEGTWTAFCYTGDHANAQGMWDKPGELAGYPSTGVENSYAAGNGATPAGALNGWKNSPAHNAVITEQGWARPLAMGVGINGNYAHLWFGYVPDPAGTAPLCPGQVLPTATPLPPTPTLSGTISAADAPPTPAGNATGSSGGRRSATEILNADGTIAANGTGQHQFTVVSGKSYTVVVTPSAQFDVDPIIGCNTNGGGILYEFDWWAEGLSETYTFDAPGDGQCTLTVRGYEGSTGTYNIKVTTI